MEWMASGRGYDGQQVRKLVDLKRDRYARFCWSDLGLDIILEVGWQLRLVVSVKLC